MEQVEWLTVPPRPVLTAPSFGTWLSTLWGDLSYEQVAIRLRPYLKPYGLKFDRTSVEKLSKGRLPNWPTIYAVSEAFDVPIVETMGQLATALGFVSKTGDDATVRHLRQTDTYGGDAPSIGGTHGPVLADVVRRNAERRKTAIELGLVEEAGAGDIIDAMRALLDALETRERGSRRGRP